MSSSQLARRHFLGRFTGVVVFAWSGRSQSSITEARADDSLAPVPPLDGTLFVDAAHLNAAADDFGHIVSRLPVAVLLPGSVEDIVKMVRYARRNGLRIAMRGQGHAQFGQGQVGGGIVIDSSSLAAVHEVRDDSADVDAGASWSQVFDAAAAHGLTPPVLTDYMELSVGGTLSVGGIGGTMQHFGTQADNVLSLTVVTGEGEIEHCSSTSNPELFDAVLAGLGQCAIIVRATVRLVRAETQALVFHLFYDDVNRYVHDQVRVLEEGRFSYLEGQAVAKADGSGFRYMIEAVTYYTPPNVPSQPALLSGLLDDVATREVLTQTYRDFAFRLAPTVAFLKSIGVWGFPHPWLSLWLPRSTTAAYVGGVVSSLTVADTGQGPVLVYPVKTHRVRRPLFRLPDEPIAFAFNILRTAVPPTPEVIAAMVASNRDLYDRAVRVGGSRYAIGAIPFEKRDWRRHFGDVWGFLVRSKRRFDPDDVLTPGPGIF